MGMNGWWILDSFLVRLDAKAFMRTHRHQHVIHDGKGVGMNPKI